MLCGIHDPRLDRSGDLLPQPITIANDSVIVAVITAQVGFGANTGWIRMVRTGMDVSCDGGVHSSGAAADGATTASIAVAPYKGE